MASDYSVVAGAYRLMAVGVAVGALYHVCGDKGLRPVGDIVVVTIVAGFVIRFVMMLRDAIDRSDRCDFKRSVAYCFALR